MALKGSIDPGFDEGAALEDEDAAGLISDSGFNSSLRPAGAAFGAIGVLTPAVRNALPLSF